MLAASGKTLGNGGWLRCITPLAQQMCSAPQWCSPCGPHAVHVCTLLKLALAHSCYRVEIMVKLLLQRLPDTQVVLLGLLPKGRGSFLQPSNFTAAHNRLNSNYG